MRLAPVARTRISRNLPCSGVTSIAGRSALRLTSSAASNPSPGAIRASAKYWSTCFQISLAFLGKAQPPEIERPYAGILPKMLILLIARDNEIRNPEQCALEVRVGQGS